MTSINILATTSSDRDPSHQIEAIYVGYDEKHPEMYLVCQRSIKKYAPDLKVVPINRSLLQNYRVYTRDDINESATEYTYTRFLVPFLNRFQGYVLYCDSNFMWRCDPRELNQYIDPDTAVSVVKHGYSSLPCKTKYDNQPQVEYGRKHWASLMLLNCTHRDCRWLMPKPVQDRPFKWLMQFKWIEDHTQLGELPLAYNYLEGGYYKKPTDIEESEIKAINFTDGGPWDLDYRYNFHYTKEWDSYLTRVELARIF